MRKNDRLPKEDLFNSCFDSILGANGRFLNICICAMMPLLSLFCRCLWSFALNSVAIALASAVAVLVMVSHLVAQPAPTSTITPFSTAQQHSAAHQQSTRQPLSFIENKGQWASEVRYMARLNGMNVWLTDGGFVYDFHRRNPDSTVVGHVVRMKFAGGTEYSDKRHIPSHGEEKQTAYYNYFIGNDRSKWASNVPLYGAVRLEEVYPGIAARAYFEEGQMRYDMIVAPNADASKIALEFDGADGVRVNGDGDLVLQTSVGDVVQGKLYAYQVRNGRRVQVECRFSAKQRNISFALGKYDPALPLVIDPLVWGTYIGGTASDLAQSATMDANGDIYIVGASASANFPTSAGAYDAMPTGSNDAIVTKLSSNGALIFSTFLGGNGTESESRICLDNSGNVYAVGLTTSTNFPMESPYDGTFNGGGEDFYIAKLTSDGTNLLYSTYFGGSDAEDYTAQPFVDAAGMIYFGGRTYSNNYPTTGGAYRTIYVSGYDGVITKLNPSLGASGLVYSTYISTAGLDHVSSIVVPPSSNLIYFGGTLGGGGLATANAFDQTYNGGLDICVGILNPLGGGTSDMQYLSYVGGSGNEANALARYDVQTGFFYLVTGSSSVNFPTTANAFQTTRIGSEDAAIAVINPAVVGAAALVYGTYIGGSGGTNQQAQYVVRGRDGRLAIVGYTDSPSFPTTPGAMQLQKRENGDIFVSVINPTRSGLASLEYSTFIGTAASDSPVQAAFTDAAGNIILVSGGSLQGLPTSVGATFNGGTADIAALKIAPTPEFPLRTGFGSSIEFDGTQRIQTQTSFARPPQWTVECWVRSPEAPSGTKTTYPFTHGPNAGIAIVWDHTNPAFRGAAQVLLSDGATYIPAKFGNLQGNTWYHLAATFDGRTLRAYQDGVLTSQQTIPSGLQPNNVPVIMGFGANPSLRFRGTIDEARYWNTALADTTISRFMGQELTGIPRQHPNAPNLIGYWQFNNYDGLIATDASPNRNGATLIGMYGDASVPATQDYTVLTSPRTPAAYTPPILASVGQPSSPFPVNVLLNGTNGGSALADVSVSGQSLQYTPRSPNFVPQGFTDRVNYRLAQERDTVSGSILVRFTPEMTSRTVYGLPNITTPMQPGAYTIFGGTAPFRYAWSPAVGLSSTTASLPSFTLATNAVYSLTVTDALGFTATTTVNVNVNGPFYYISGDAAERSSWNADSAGTESAPLSMAIPAEFIVRSTKAAQLQTSLTIINGGTFTIQTGGTLSIADGVTLENRGTVQIGGSLTLQDRAAVSATPIRWLGTKAVLNYVGTKPTLATSVEFPAAMTIASVVVDNSGGVSLNGSKTISTAFSLRANALCNTNAATLSLAGEATLAGRFTDDASGMIAIEGSGTILGTLNIAAPSNAASGTVGRLNALTVNRPGLRLALGTPLTLSGRLILTSGTIIAPTVNFLRIAASRTDAVMGGSRQSFVEGAVQRVIPPNLATDNTQEYRFPTGQGSAYLPFALIAPVSGAEGAIVQAQAFNDQVSGSIGDNLATLTGVGYWQTRLVSGSLAQTRVSIGPIASLLPLSSVARSDTRTGVFVGLGASEIGTTAIVSLPITDSALLNGVFALGANAPPTIASFSPESGTSGTVVTITGEHFTTSATVRFGGIAAASVRVVSRTELQAIVANGGTTGSIVVTTAFGSAESGQVFRYLLPPTISSFAPRSLSAGGSVVIRGTQFSAPAEVFFGGVAASDVNVNSDEQITVKVGAGGTSGALTVRTRSGSATAQEEFTFEAAPTITGFGERAVTTGANLSIFGTNFLGTMSVRVGGIGAELLAITAKQVRVRVPAGIAASPAVVALATPFGETTSTISIPLTAPAAIASFSPTVGFAGTRVVLRGAGFLGVTTLTIAGVGATFTIDNDSQISAVAGDVRSRGKVVVQGSTGRAESSGDFAPPAPLLTSFMPGAATSGTAVMLKGMNFQIVTSVTLGGVAVSRFTIDSPTQITVVTPTRERGSGIVLVQSAGGTARSDEFFTFVPTQATVRSPRITDFTPKVGGLGTTITVSGTNLDSALVGYVGGVLATRVVSVSSTQAVFTLGTGASGSVQVLTVNGVGTSSERLTFYTPRQVDSLTLREAARIWAERTNNASNAQIDWLSTIPMERWRGITIEQGRVTGIAVTSATLSGALPDTLGQLTSLKTFILNSCFLEAALPRFLERLTALQVLDLSNNALSGSIPPSVLLLPELRSLNLSRNRLTGRLQLGDATQVRKNLATVQSQTLELSQLDLSGNLLTGDIPSDWRVFPFLRTLSLADNRFTGAAPDALASLSFLEELHLSGNRLTGLPDMTSLRRLRTLAVERNQLDFAALRANVSLGNRIQYIPQDSIGEMGVVHIVPLESRFSLNPRLRGTRVSYRWLKNGEEVQAASVDSLRVFPFVRPGDAGVYVCQATSNIPNLTLTTSSVTLRTTDPLPPTDIVSLRQPLNESSNVSTAATLRWQAIPPTPEGNVRTLWYEAQVAPDSTFIRLAALVTTASVEASVEGLAPLKAYYWRVRAVNSGGAGAWSPLWRFVTASGTAELVLTVAPFPRTVLGDSSKQAVTITNQAKVNLTMEEGSISGDTENFTMLPALKNQTLRPGESVEVPIRFAPRAAASARDTSVGRLDLRYSVAGLPIVQTTSATLSGRTGVFSVQTALPDTVVVGRRLVSPMTVINRWKKAIMLETVQTTAGAVFRFADSTVSRIKLGVNDTTVVSYSCLARNEGAISGALTLKGYEETQAGVTDDALVNFRTTARQPSLEDVIVRFGLRPSADKLPPGSLVSLSIVLDSGNREKLFQSVNPAWLARIAFDRNVLVPITEGQSNVRLLNNSDSIGRSLQIQVSGAFANPRSDVLGTVDCRVVAGDTVRTRLQLVSMEITTNASTRQVFQEQPQDTTFTAAVSRAGGVRLIAPAAAKIAILSLSPNPALESIEIAYTLAGAASPEIYLNDATGKTVYQLANGRQQAGNYTIRLDVSGLASGAYTLILRTAMGMASQKIMVER